MFVSIERMRAVEEIPTARIQIVPEEEWGWGGGGGRDGVGWWSDVILMIRR